ncbi:MULTISPECIES: cyclase family protein [unclassified Methanoculleus]|jgi:kynurenine formamidase|uniref:cyclase family protein n=1 Tax=unclassified Methanoculleus TaxID=2619537 RepID=UPI0025FFC5DB|nr:cyclase family protein [Methanoculleus sp. UBA377]MDD2473125.1 cyclase family protein [Methanoculleus sp.]
MLIPISYPLTRATPLYPGTEPLTITPTKSFAEGDAEEKSQITFSSHAGTHIDLPRHFCPDGGSVRSLLAPEAVFAPARCIAVQKTGEEPIRIHDLLPHLDAIRNSRALFIRTGNGLLRETDRDIYEQAHPWVHPEVPGFLRMENPALRLFGIDTISVAVPGEPEEGAEVHRAFLCTSPHIFVLEDVDLSYGRLLEEPWILRIYPVVFDDLEGVPVVALAEFG